MNNAADNLSKNDNNNNTSINDGTCIKNIAQIPNKRIPN